VVPQSITRPREVWTTDERKAIQRVLDLMNLRGLKVQFICNHPDCHENGGRITQRRSEQGEPIWECDHKTRVFTSL
jgi:hypothetical protein